MHGQCLSPGPLAVLDNGPENRRRELMVHRVQKTSMFHLRWGGGGEILDCIGTQVLSRPSQPSQSLGSKDTHT